MKVKKFNWFLDLVTPKDVIGITLFPFGIFTRSDIPDKITIQHELIHYTQQKECLVVFFYIIYLIEYIFKGYYRISFEIEAYKNEDDEHYLKNRKHFSWLNCI